MTWSLPSSRIALSANGGPKGSAKVRWLKSACVGFTKAKLSRGKTFHKLPIFADGVVQVAGQVIHPSHTLVVYRGFFMCLHCGYSAGEFVVKLSSPCCGQLSPSRKTILEKLCKGELPYSRTKRPAEPPPPSPS